MYLTLLIWFVFLDLEAYVIVVTCNFRCV